MDLKSEIEQITRGVVSRPSYFQLNFLLLGREPTIQAKLRKCVDELKFRQQSLENAALEQEEILDTIELLECEIGDLDSSRVQVIKERQLKRRITSSLKRLDDIKARVRALEEECVFFVEAYKSLSMIEKPRSWEDDDVQLEYWSEKYAREIKERLMLRMPIDVEVVRSVLCLPDGTSVKEQVVQMIHNVGKMERDNNGICRSNINS